MDHRMSFWSQFPGLDFTRGFAAIKKADRAVRIDLNFSLDQSVFPFDQDPTTAGRAHMDSRGFDRGFPQQCFEETDKFYGKFQNVALGGSGTITVPILGQVAHCMQLLNRSGHTFQINTKASAKIVTTLREMQT